MRGSAPRPEPRPRPRQRRPPRPRPRRPRRRPAPPQGPLHPARAAAPEASSGKERATQEKARGHASAESRTEPPLQQPASLKHKSKQTFLEMSPQEISQASSVRLSAVMVAEPVDSVQTKGYALFAFRPPIPQMATRPLLRLPKIYPCHGSSKKRLKAEGAFSLWPVQAWGCPPGCFAGAGWALKVEFSSLHHPSPSRGVVGVQTLPQQKLTFHLRDFPVRSSTERGRRAI